MEQLQSFDPATGESVGSVAVTPPEQVAQIVAAARAAQPAWEARGLAGRAEVLKEAAAAILDDAERLGELLCREMGKPIRSATGEVRSVGAVADEIDEMVEALSPVTVSTDRVVTDTLHDPYGVCAAITPWNFPISMPSWMCLPALVAGNTVVLKPSEETPLIADEYVRILNRVLPEGVLQVVHGDERQGKALVAADVDLIAFTGSRAAGAAILEAGASKLKRVILELGGKDPMLVLPGSDVDRAAKFAVNNSFRNAGQVCVSTERIYVHESLADEFEAKVVQGANEMQQGSGLDEGVQLGPMINGHQRDHVLGQISAAVADGATLAAGGQVEGNFIRPAVLLGVDHSMGVMRDETFGPVACVVRVADDEEAVRLANDTPYGLGAVVFGEEERAAAAARRIRAGMVGINRGIGGAPGSPWVGAKQSGYGFHGGPDGHRQFAQRRTVSRRA